LKNISPGAYFRNFTVFKKKMNDDLHLAVVTFSSFQRGREFEKQTHAGPNLTSKITAKTFVEIKIRDRK